MTRAERRQATRRVFNRRIAVRIAAGTAFLDIEGKSPIF